MDIFGPRQWNWNRLPVFREDFRYVSTAARSERNFRDRSGLNGVQENCRTSSRPNLGRIVSGKRLDLLPGSARRGGKNILGCIGKRSAGEFRARCPKLTQASGAQGL